MSVAPPVIIDTDPGIDDALALALAFRSPELNISMVSTVAGNVDIGPATLNAGLLLDLFEAPSPCLLAKGSAKPLRGSRSNAENFHAHDGLGGTRNQLIESGVTARRASAGAVKRMVQAAREFGDNLTIIALGPLTNIAHAVRLDPVAMAGIGKLVVMGGAVRVAGNVSAAAEFNFYADPHAAAVVIGAGLPTTLVPLDVTEQVRLTGAELRSSLRGRRDAQAQALRAMLALPNGRNVTSGIALHDPLAVAVAIAPHIVETQMLPIDVVCDGAAAGMSLEDRRIHGTAGPSGSMVAVAVTVDVEAARELFLSRVMYKDGVKPRASAKAIGVTVVGSTNIDLIVRSPHLPRPGETVLGEDLLQAAGGKGANQAVAAARAGARVSLISRVGRDAFGSGLITGLADCGVDVSGVDSDERATGVALICVDHHGQNQIVVASGANEALAAHHIEALRGAIIDSKVLVAQLEIPIASVIAALSVASEAGVMTILNPAPVRSLPPFVVKMTDILVANEVEAEALVGQPIGTVPEVRRALAQLEKMGYTNAVITQGRRGAMWRAGGTHGRVRAYPVEAVDATAAGDTFVGYLAVAMAEGAELGEAVEWANQAAAITVTRRGARDAIPTRAEVTRSFPPN